jgi:hypothetical protein
MLSFGHRKLLVKYYLFVLAVKCCDQIEKHNLDKCAILTQVNAFKGFAAAAAEGS